MSTTASIAKKGLKDTGFTEDHAKRFHDQLGRDGIAIIQFVSDSRSEKRNGDESVSLSITSIEPAPDNTTADHLRELARAFHYERRLADDQPLPLDGDSIEPKVTDVLKAGARHLPHPFLPTDASDDTPICDVCGVVEDAAGALHDVDQDDDGDGDEQEDPDDEDEGHDDEAGGLDELGQIIDDLDDEAGQPINDPEAMPATLRNPFKSV